MRDDVPMGPMTTEVALATALDGMVLGKPVADVLARLMQDCLEVLPADAAAVLVLDGDGGLELISASSHRAEELELLQIQLEAGPCVEAIHLNQVLEAHGRELVERWGEVGTAIGEAGFDQVRAYPLRWHGRPMGGLNVLCREARSVEDTALGQVFADLATLVIVHAAEVSTERVLARVHEAVSARAVIEQAKGVLAVELEVEPDQAYDLLVQRSRDTQVGLTAMAARLVSQAHEH